MIKNIRKNHEIRMNLRSCQMMWQMNFWIVKDQIASRLNHFWVRNICERLKYTFTKTKLKIN